MLNDVTFGKELRRLRRGHCDNISLADIAEHLDCSVTYVSAIERDERNPPSPEKIKAILEFLGRVDEYPKMLELAARSRKAVEIPIDESNEKLTHLLLGLARRSEEGLSDDDPLIAKLKEVFDQDEEEIRCRPLCRESERNRNAKSKTKRT